MLLKQQEFYGSLTALAPGLVERIRRTIEEAEKKFSGKKDAKAGFLWEHTVLVAAQSYRLAKAEKENPDLAALVALSAALLAAAALRSSVSTKASARTPRMAPGSISVRSGAARVPRFSCQ